MLSVSKYNFLQSMVLFFVNENLEHFYKEGQIYVLSICAVSSMMAVPATVIYFTCYDQLCAALRVRMGDHAQEAPLLAGATARGEPSAVPLSLQYNAHRDERIT